MEDLNYIWMKWMVDVGIYIYIPYMERMGTLSYTLYWKINHLYKYLSKNIFATFHSTLRIMGSQN